MTPSTTAPKRLSTPRPLQLTNSNVDSQSYASSSSVPSTLDSPGSIPSSSPRRKTSSRRQGSIAYLPHDSRPRYNTQLPAHLKRNKSVDSKLDGSSFVQEHRNSTGSIAEHRPLPLTLTEKHADLLRFIAQKESKCMELRSQLAVHEAELKQLKRKWERIVNKGYDRVIGMHENSAPSSGQVFGGIKEGVERFLAAGLGELTPATSTQPVATATMRIHPMRQSVSSVGTNSNTSIRYSQSSTNSSATEDDSSLESLGGQERDGKLLIVENAELTLTVSPHSAVKIAEVTEISSMEQDKTTKKCRRRSRDASPPRKGQLATVPENKTARVNMAPLSSIPGLGSLPPGTPSWVIGTVGKKWEELQRTETFAKNQKRASLLISDMSQSLMNVWSLPAESPASSMSNPSAVDHLRMSHKLPITSSLLDDDGDSPEALGEVMTPDSRLNSSPARTRSTTLDGSKVKVQEGDEEWNW